MILHLVDTAKLECQQHTPRDERGFSDSVACLYKVFTGHSTARPAIANLIQEDPVDLLAALPGEAMSEKQLRVIILSRKQFDLFQTRAWLYP